MDLFDLSNLNAERERLNRRYYEFLRIPALSAGVYHLFAGSVDPQTPHAEDEVYHVVNGRATIRVGAEDQPVGPGSILLVRAQVEHRFHTITEDLTVFVFFAPAESR